MIYITRMALSYNHIGYIMLQYYFVINCFNEVLLFNSAIIAYFYITNI